MMPQRPRILLIDDNEFILEGLKTHLTARFEVVTASDGFDALKNLSDEAFDLIITDLLMPASSGFGLIASLRQHHPRTPIIVMTGWGKPPQSDTLKADTLLVKPFDLEELDQTIGEVLVSKSG